MLIIAMNSAVTVLRVYIVHSTDTEQDSVRSRGIILADIKNT